LRHEHRDDPSPSVEAAEINSLMKENAALKRKLAALEQQPSSLAPAAPGNASEATLGEKEMVQDPYFTTLPAACQCPAE
jgi:hypothetical protein